MNKALVIGLSITLVVVAFLIIRNRKKTKNQTEPQDYQCPEYVSKFSGEPALESSEGVDMDVTVKIGDYGSEVVYLQQRLNSQYGAGVNVDGKFGCETHFALSEFTGLNGSEPIDLNDLK